MNSSHDTVFLVGSVRSGTTLLRVLLDRHPHLRWFGEFEYPVKWCADTGWPNVADYKERLAVDRAFRRDRLSIDPSLDYVDLVRSFLEQHRERASAARVLGCTVHSRPDRLPELWPEARYVHFLRDPRDVARSCVAMGWAGHAAAGVETWLAAEERWDALRVKAPSEQTYELRYEDLVREPEATLSALCDFLGVAFDPQMLDPGPDSTYGPPDASLAEQWRRKAKPRDVRRMEARLGHRLADRGYEPSGLPALHLGRPERAWLSLRNRWGRWNHAARKYGAALWFKRALAAKRIGPRGWRDRVQLRVNEIDTQRLR